MELECGSYRLLFTEGGIEVRNNDRLLYANKRPMFVTVKTAFAVSEFYDGAYADIAASDGQDHSPRHDDPAFGLGVRLHGRL